MGIKLPSGDAPHPFLKASMNAAEENISELVTTAFMEAGSTIT